MSWVVLLAAGLLETVWALGLKYTQGFTRPLPSAVTIAAIVGSIWLLAIAAKTLPIGTAYTVWVGIGVVGTVVGGIVLMGEPVSVGRISLLGLLILSIIGLKVTGS